MSAGTCLVTGAAGFVGGHICRRLLEMGFRVRACDVVPLDQARLLAGLGADPNFSYVAFDIRDVDAVNRFVTPDATHLFHLASVVGVSKYLADPLALIDTIVIGTRNLVAACLPHGIRFLFTSTSEVYGRNPKIPWAEDDDRVLGSPAVDRWSYSSSKAVCEHMLFALAHSGRLPVSIVRFFNVYGPGQNPIFVVSNNVARALRGEALLRYDGGTQTRCFTYVGDAVDGTIRAATMPEAIGQAFNIGNQTESTIGSVIDIVWRLTGKRLEITDLDTAAAFGKRYEDIERRVPDAGKADRLLGWRATTPLEEGITHALDWARENPWWYAA